MNFFPTIDQALESESESALPMEPEFLLPTSITRRASVLPSFKKEIGDKEIESFFFQVAPTNISPKYFARVRLSATDINRTFSLFQSGLAKGELVKPEDVIDNIIYWDERTGQLYVEAIASFGTTEGFIRFRKDISTELHISGYPCPIDGSTDWAVRDVDAKTVLDSKGKRWKCFSILFVCKACRSQGRVTQRQISMLGFKHTMTKLGIGVRDFVNRITKVKVKGNLEAGQCRRRARIGQKCEIEDYSMSLARVIIRYFRGDR